MLRALAIVLAIGIVFILIVVALYYLVPSPPVHVADRLCDFIRGDLKMECVAVIATSASFRPGAIVEYSPTPQGDARIPLPIADLSSSVCQVPGVNAVSIASRTGQSQPISLPQLTYDTNRSLKVGAEVELPKLSGVRIEAGPNWSNVAKIDLSVDEAWTSTLDENVAVAAFTSCQVQKSCVDRILAERYRVVGTTVITKGLKYKITAKDGGIVSLTAASKELKVNLGGATDIRTSTDATLTAADPRVIGVRLLPVNVFAGKQTCQETVFYSADGAALATVMGGGGVGNIGPLRRDKQPLGKTARVQASGTEASECDAGFERNVSAALAEGKVEQLSPTALRFTYNLSAHGGHYATAATCLGPRLVGTTGHDTNAAGSIELLGTVFVTLRSDSSPLLHLEYKDVPTGTQIRVVDWKSEPLREVRTSKDETQPARPLKDLGNLFGSGNHAFATQGAGVYRVETTIQVNASVNGNQGNATSQTADVLVSLGE